jgi:hypothetical protein
MKIDVFFTPTGFDDAYLHERIVVVIDVLRASTSIVAALQNGAKEIIAVEEIEDAHNAASTLFDERPLLCGERHGKIIDGFDLGNSPEQRVGRQRIHVEIGKCGQSFGDYLRGKRRSIFVGRHALRGTLGR